MLLGRTHRPFALHHLHPSFKATNQPSAATPHVELHTSRSGVAVSLGHISRTEFSRDCPSANRHVPNNFPESFPQFPRSTPSALLLKRTTIIAFPFPKRTSHPHHTFHPQALPLLYLHHVCPQLCRHRQGEQRCTSRMPGLTGPGSFAHLGGIRLIPPMRAALHPFQSLLATISSQLDASS